MILSLLTLLLLAWLLLKLVRGIELAVEFFKLRAETHAAQVISSLHRERVNSFLDDLTLSWYQLVVIFALGSFLGLVVEQIWMFITAGLTEHRYGLVWGPFSPIYGFGATFLTLLSWKLRERGSKWWQVFLCSMVVGGALEQFTGWAMETFMGAVSWDYSNVPGAITKWVAWPFLFFWGVLGLVWAEKVMPELLYRIGKPTKKRQVIAVAVLAIYLVADIFMTLACFERIAARDAGVAPRNGFEAWIDEHYSDEFVANRFENMVFDNQSES